MTHNTRLIEEARNKFNEQLIMQPGPRPLYLKLADALEQAEAELERLAPYSSRHNFERANKAEAENVRLREALEKISEHSDDTFAVGTARSVLRDKP